MDTEHNILFVDSDSRLLRGLQRALGSQVGFGLFFAQKGENAFDIIKDRQIDFVVSGLEVGDMSGNKMLETVKKINPSSVRVMFSGLECPDDAGPDSPVQIYIDRPCESNGVIKKIQSISRRWRFAPAEYRRAVLLSQTPSLLPVTAEYINDNELSDSSDDQLVELLAQDPGYICQSLYRQRRDIDRMQFTSLTDMVRKLIEKDVLHNGVLSSGVRCTKDCNKMVFQKKVYQHSLLTAKLACDIAGDRFGKNSNITSQALLAGLLHDIGKVIITEQYSQQYRLAVPYDDNDCGMLKNYNGDMIDHHLFGGMVFSLWGLHDNIVDAIAGLSGKSEGNNCICDILIAADRQALDMVVN